MFLVQFSTNPHDRCAYRRAGNRDRISHGCWTGSWLRHFFQQHSHHWQTCTLYLYCLSCWRLEDQLLYLPLLLLRFLLDWNRYERQWCDRILLLIALAWILFLVLDDPIVIDPLIWTILAKTTTFPELVEVLHDLFKIRFTIHNSSVSIRWSVYCLSQTSWVP